METEEPHLRFRSDRAAATALDRTYFGLLGATTRDDRRRIVDLAEEKSLTLDADACARARADLCNPRQRVAAEVAWLPGLSPSRVDRYRGLLGSDLLRLKLDADDEAPLVRANLVAAAMELLDSSVDVGCWITWITALADAADAIAPDEVLRTIDEDRAAAGFPAVAGVDVVADELRKQRLRYRRVITETLDRFPTAKMVEVLSDVVDRATASGTRPAPALLDEVVDGVETAARPFLDSEATSLRSLLKAVRETAGGGDAVIAPALDAVARVLRSWHRMARPLQLSARARGLEHESSKQLAYEVRELAIDLCNEHRLYGAARRITALLQDVFASVPAMTDRLAEDAEAIDRIVANQEKSREETAAWTQRMTYEARVGLVFKDTLRISPERIEWKGASYPLAAITRIGWGATRQSVSGIPAGTTYAVFLASAQAQVAIRLRTEAVFTEFVNRLWAMVGSRLLDELRRGLGAGERYEFGNAVLDDVGLLLTKRRWFRANEQVHASWDKLRMWSANGFLFIAMRDMPRAQLVLPYQAANNAHVLETAVRAVLQSTVPVISLALEG